MGRMLSRIVIAAMVSTIAAPAMGQDTGRAEVGLGYSLVGIIEEDAPNLPAGWLGSVAVRITDWVCAVGEGAGNYKSEDDDLLTLHTYQGGARIVAGRNPKIRPFGQFLLGGVTVFAEGEYFNRFVMEPGGGVDLPIGRGNAVRLGAGFPIIFSGGETINLFRIHAGLVF